MTATMSFITRTPDDKLGSIISNLFSLSGTSSRLQKQMTIMNKNLNSKLEELHGFQAIDTNVALTEIRSQLHELTKSVESCQVSTDGP